jgi:hypothetical protein
MLPTHPDAGNALRNPRSLAGNNNVVKLSGNTFTTVTDVPPASYRSVWVSPTQVWFGARNGVISHRAR